MIRFTEVYITGVRYKSQSWVNNPDYLLDEIANYLNDIRHFKFDSLSLNMSQVYNVAIKDTNYSAMMLFIKGIKYCGHSFLSTNQCGHDDEIMENDIVELRDRIIAKLTIIPEFEFVDVQIRSVLKYEYLDMFGTDTKTQKQYQFDRR